MDVQRESDAINVIRVSLLPQHIEVKDRSRTVYAMAGIPGSGKSTFVRKMIENGLFPLNAYVLCPDQIMELLPEYQHEYEQLGPEEAFKRWEMPARSIAYLLLEEAINLRFDIIQDIGNARWENYEMLRRLKNQHGYHLKMYWLDICPEVALSRIAQRSRFVPETMIWERFKSLQNLKQQYIALVDEFSIVQSEEII